MHACPSAGVEFYAGVPDSLPGSFCEEVSRMPHHVTPCDEGAAVALAIGAHFANGTVPLVYPQNDSVTKRLVIQLTHEVSSTQPSTER